MTENLISNFPEDLQDTQDLEICVAFPDLDPLKVYTDMLQLWDVHVALTREVVLADSARSPAHVVPVIPPSPNLASAVVALYQNQVHLGDDLAQFYGPEAGDEYSRLLKIHIDLAIKIVDDMIDGLDPKDDIAAWYANGDDLARFLAKTVRCVRFKRIQELIKAHLACTLKEAILIIQKDYAGSQAEFQTCLGRIKELSAYLSKKVVADGGEMYEMECK